MDYSFKGQGNTGIAFEKCLHRLNALVKWAHTITMSIKYSIGFMRKSLRPPSK